MTIRLANLQRRIRVDIVRMRHLARRASRQLRIRAPGTLMIAFVSPARMRALNRRFLRHDRPTDVLSFRYPADPACPASRAAQQVVGDIVVSPSAARAYAQRHGLRGTQEMARYVVHGLLHWLGRGDRTPSERRTMRALEDRLLAGGLAPSRTSAARGVPPGPT